MLQFEVEDFATAAQNPDGRALSIGGINEYHVY